LKLLRLAALSVLVGVAVGLYACLVEPRWLKCRQEEVELLDWPRSLDGLRLGIVGDTHVGTKRGRPWTSPALDAAVRAINEDPVDLLLLVGDYGYVKWDPEDLATIVARFDAPLRVAITGNHDWARGAARVEKLRLALESCGIHVLVNDVVELSIRGEWLAVAGLADLYAGRMNVEQTVAALPSDRGPTILLSHAPDAVRRVPAEAFDLAVSGHTHGGQIALPFVMSYILSRFAHTTFNRGWYDVTGRRLFVTTGVGLVGHRARFRSRPEVAIITVRTAKT
jgi:predicted MPP superfamily phosphohydrolase